MDELLTTDSKLPPVDFSRARLQNPSGLCVDQTSFPDILARLRVQTGFRPDLFMAEHGYEGKWMEVNGVSFSDEFSTPGVS